MNTTNENGMKVIRYKDVYYSMPWNRGCTVHHHWKFPKSNVWCYIAAWYGQYGRVLSLFLLICLLGTVFPALCEHSWLLFCVPLTLFAVSITIDEIASRKARPFYSRRKVLHKDPLPLPRIVSQDPSGYSKYQLRCR